MKSSSRLLVAFGITIGVLVVIVIVLGLTLSGEQTVSLLPEDTPEGTVQRYILAIQDKDYEKAYSYLSPTALVEEEEEDNSYYASYENWSRPYSWRGESSGWKATQGESSITGDEATVEVTIEVFRPEVPFADPVCSRHYTFQLRKEDTSWRITSPLYPLYL
jgi:hypothetical protein